MILVFQPKELICRWVLAKMRYRPAKEWEPDTYQVIGLTDSEGRLQCACIYHDYRSKSIEMSISAVNPKWATRGNIRAFLHYPFEQLNVNHVRAVIHCKNKRARRMVERIGFIHEGSLREAAEDGKNLLIYGMTREDAVRWLGERKSDGQGHQAA